MKRTIILICIMLGTVLTGCGIVPKTNVIEEISPSIVIYVDRNEEGKLVQIALIPTSSEESIKYLTTDVDIMKEARNNFSRKLPIANELKKPSPNQKNDGVLWYTMPLTLFLPAIAKENCCLLIARYLALR